MAYSVSFEVHPGIFFGIAENTPQALEATLGKFGFRLDISHVKDVIAGNADTAASFLATQVNELVARQPAQVELAAEANDPVPAQNDDPWGSEGSADPNEDDPWGSPSAERPTNAQSASSGTSSAQGATQGVSKTSDRFGREYVMNLPGAKTCECGEPAAKMTAKSQKSGNIYHKWVCARTAGENWRNKCDFGEFTK